MLFAAGDLKNARNCAAAELRVARLSRTASMIGFADTFDRTGPNPGALWTGADLEVRAHRVIDGEMEPDAFYMAQGSIFLEGTRSELDPYQTAFLESAP